MDRVGGPGLGSEPRSCSYALADVRFLLRDDHPLPLVGGGPCRPDAFRFCSPLLRDAPSVGCIVPGASKGSEPRSRTPARYVPEALGCGVQTPRALDS